MEIGHNVLHGQWDWMRDPDIHSTTWEWDFVTPAAAWKHTHNDLHHTWTNVLGKDKDVGYSTLRMAEDQPWRPYNLLNPRHQRASWLPSSSGASRSTTSSSRRSRTARSPRRTSRRTSRPWAARSCASSRRTTPRRRSPPCPSAPASRRSLGTFTANAIRNVWAHSVIFCGHFPDGVDVFTEEEIEGETRGDWYIRQMLGSANISGSKLMHLMTGNLSHQIEHHCFPDLPSNRYHEVAVEVREICQRYGLPYTTGPLPKQVGQAWAKVFRLALPNRPKPLPKGAVNAPVPPRRVALPLAASVG